MSHSIQQSVSTANNKNKSYSYSEFEELKKSKRNKAKSWERTDKRSRWAVDE